jgi:hypothetical protein
MDRYRNSMPSKCRACRGKATDIFQILAVPRETMCLLSPVENLLSDIGWVNLRALLDVVVKNN